jgi:hypothetical protein
MPLIDDLKTKKTNKFVKKPYRPWQSEDLDNNSLTNSEVPSNPDIVETEIPEKNKTESSNKLAPKTDLLRTEKLKNDTSKEEDNITLTSENLTNTQAKDLEKFYRGLYGVQKIVLQSILEDMSHNEDGFGFSHPLVYNEFSLSIKIPINSIKGALQKLKQAGILEIYDSKPGRGGYGCYKIKEDVIMFFKNKQKY